MIRQCGPEDLDFMLDVAAERYPPFDRGAAREWGLKALADPATLLARSDQGFIVVSVAAPFFAPTEWEARLLFLVSAGGPWDGLRLLRYAAGLTRQAGIQFRFGSSTETDLEPYAKRLGARKAKPSFVL